MQSLPPLPSAPKEDIPSTEDLQPLTAWCSSHELSAYFTASLYDLYKRKDTYNIALVLDNSGSMNKCDVQGPDGFLRTRWAECTERIAELHHLISLLGMTLHIYAMNPLEYKYAGSPDFKVEHKSVIRVAPGENIHRIFASVKPAGPTPMLQTMKMAVAELRDKNILLIVATDGEPTSSAVPDYRAKEEVKTWLLKERDHKRVSVTFMACTDSDAIDYLNAWDRERHWRTKKKIFKSFDVVDDFASEAKEYEKHQLALGVTSPTEMYHGLYTLKMLLGAIDTRLGQLDEQLKKPTKERVICTIL